MIHIWWRSALAILADGRAMIGEIGDSPNTTWTEVPFIMADVALIKSCPHLSMLAILMHDGRIQVGIKQGEITDITDCIANLFKDKQAVRDIYVNKGTLVITGSHTIGLINLAQDGTVVNKESYQLSFTIELVSLCSSYGLVKTIDGRLLQIADKDGDSPIALIEPKPVCEDVINIQGIIEIHCCTSWVTFLFADGSVHIYKFHNNLQTPVFSTALIFPKETAVTKIVNAINGSLYALYLTAKGECYYYFNDWMNWCMKPAPYLIDSLSGQVIEKATALCQSSSFMVQGDDKVVSLLYLKPHHDRYNSIGQEDLHHLAFYDDKGIVSVHESGCCTLFVSQDGHVYREYNVWSSDQNTTRYEFFDTNPIAVETGQRIRSAGSNL